MVTRQLQVDRRTAKVRQSKTDVLPLCHATNLFVGCVVLNVRIIMSETLIKLDKNSKKCSNCPPRAFTQACSVGIENKRSFVEIKQVPVVKLVEIGRFIFAKVV